jgi:prevent-host-death family protein
MKTVSITEAKNRLSALIDGLKGGSRVLIVDRGRPVARLEPVTGVGKSEQDGRLARLVREGIVRPSRAPFPRALLSDLPPGPKGGTGAVEALLEERREGR